MPDCAWCDAAETLDHVWTEMGVGYYQCTCCEKFTRVGHDGISQRIIEPSREPACDVSGQLIDGP